MKLKHLISIDELSRREIIHILDYSTEFEKDKTKKNLRGKTIATVFYEPSTRTRLSFESAVSKLGGDIIGISEIKSSSVTKGESLKDTIKMISSYSDLIVLRHPNEGASRYASEISNVPVINAGDGANQHPTQTLLDLYSIKKNPEKN